ncbi:MAG: hypothetical protein INR65_06610 [Gluconacetobacter diazotrophicus]|nr:hypothetical protein [Gluconacetobacter diazotrophicus]
MNDAKLRRAILDEQDRIRKRYGVSGTPCFVFGSRVEPVVADHDGFARYISAAGG